MATADDSYRHRSEGSDLFVVSVCNVSEQRAVDNNCGHLK